MLKRLYRAFSQFYLPNVAVEDRKLAFLGIFGGALVFLGLVASYIIFVPPLISGDEFLHLDYIWTVYNGNLPNFFHGPQLIIEGLASPPAQWVAQHPPLYYFLLAPFVGPLIANQDVMAAIYAARGLSAAFGLVAVLAVPFFLNRWGVRNKTGLILSALLAATVVRFIGVDGAIYNDSLAILLSIISIGSMGVLLINGRSRKYLIILIVSLSLGMLTRSSTAISLLFGCLTIFYIYSLRTKAPSWPRRLGNGLVPAVVCGLTAIAVSGWYYVRNYHIGGSLTGLQPEWAVEHLNQHRAITGVGDVLASPRFLKLPFQFFSDTANSLFVIASALLLVAGLFFIAKVAANKKVNNRILLVGLLSLLLFLVTFFMQAYYSATQAGALNIRYLLPALLPLIFLLVVGVYQLRLVGVLAAICLAVGGIVSTFINIMNYTGGRFVTLPNGPLGLGLPSGLAADLAAVFLGLILLGGCLVLGGLAIRRPAHKQGL